MASSVVDAGLERVLRLAGEDLLRDLAMRAGR